MKKILYIIDDLRNAGAQRHLVEVLKQLDKNKYQPAVCTVMSDAAKRQSAGLIGNLKAEIESLGISVKSLHLKRIYHPTVILKLIALWRFIRKERFAVIQTYLFCADVLGSIAAKFAGVKAIITTRREVGIWNKRHYVWAYRLTNAFAHKILTVSRAVERFSKKQERIPSSKPVVTIYNGIDLSRFDYTAKHPEKRAELNILPNDVVVGIVANLIPVKDQFSFIRAASQVLKKLRNVKFLLVGDGALRGELKELAENLGIQDSVYFLGKRKDVPQLLSIMDVFVLCSLSEGMSNALLEAMAMAKPVVVTDVGGNTETVEHEKNGLLVPPQNPTTLSDSILKLLTDKELAGKLSYAARREVERKFSSEVMVRKMERLYENQWVPEQQQCYSVKADSRKTVMHIIHSLPADGAEQLLLDILRNSDWSRYRFLVCAISEGGPLVAEYERMGIPVTVLGKRFKFDFSALPRLVGLLRKEQVDIVHTHMFTAHAWGGTAAILANVPRIIATLHNTAFSKKRYMQWVERFLARYIHKFIAVSKEAYDSAHEHERIPKSKMVTIINGVDLDRFDVPVNVIGKKRELGLVEDAPVVGIIARLFPQKGHQYFLAAAELIAKERSDVQFLIVGDGVLRPQLERIVQQSELLRKRVHFTGVRRDIPEIMRVIDVFALSSLWEGLPVVLLEAMGMKRTVVATSVGGVPELITHGKTGLLVPPENPEALSSAIMSLLDNPDRAIELGMRAYARIKKYYSVQRTAYEYQRVYESTINCLPPITTGYKIFDYPKIKKAPLAE